MSEKPIPYPIFVQVQVADLSLGESFSTRHIAEKINFKPTYIQVAQTRKALNKMDCVSSDRPGGGKEAVNQ